MMRPAHAFILMIGDDGAMLAAADVNLALFVKGHDAEAILPILDALKSQPQRPVLILADVLAQDFRRETLPRLGLLDRKKLQVRRLQQTFPLALMRAVLPLSHHSVLFAALHEGGVIGRWLDQLAAMPNPAGGVCLLPLESAGLLRQLMPQSVNEWAVLLSWQRTGGFRQIVTHKGELIFTRLTPPLPMDADGRDIALAAARDLQATRGYLSRLGLKEDAKLHAAVILPAQAHEALTGVSLPVQSLMVFTPHEAARQLALPLTPAPDDPAADMLHAGWLMRKIRPRVKLMRTEVRQAQRVARIKRYGARAAVAAWVLALGLLGWQGQDLLRAGMTNGHLAAENAALQKQLEQERATLVPVTQPLGRLRQAVERRRLYTEPVVVPWGLFDAVGQVLDPAFRLTQMEWVYGGGKKAAEKIEFSLRLEDAAPKQAAAQRFDQLAASLRRRLPDYTVAILHYPFAVLPEETLSNDEAPKQKVDKDARFVVSKVMP